MTLKEVKAVYDRVVKKKKARPEGMTAPGCEYFVGGHGNGFCKATTQTSCRKCRSYTPNMPTRGSILAEYILEREKRVEELAARTVELENKVDGLETMVADFREFARLVSYEVQEEAQEEEKEEEDA